MESLLTFEILLVIVAVGVILYFRDRIQNLKQELSMSVIRLEFRVQDLKLKLDRINPISGDLENGK